MVWKRRDDKHIQSRLFNKQNRTKTQQPSKRKQTSHKMRKDNDILNFHRNHAVTKQCSHLIYFLSNPAVLTYIFNQKNSSRFHYGFYISEWLKTIYRGIWNTMKENPTPLQQQDVLLMIVTVPEINKEFLLKNTWGHLLESLKVLGLIVISHWALSLTLGLHESKLEHDENHSELSLCRLESTFSCKVRLNERKNRPHI